MSQPTSARPVRFPEGYGSPDPADLLPWNWAEERLRNARNYWLSSVRPDGRPHARPVDGVWVEGALCFGGGPEASWVRNLAANPALSCHIPGDDEVVIVEGTVERVTDASHPLAIASTPATREKYPQYFSGDDSPSFEPFWALRPRVAYAWTLTGFPARATRWTFEANV